MGGEGSTTGPSPQPDTEVGTVAKDIGEGLEWDPADAKKWSDEDFEANCKYLLDRGGDVDGTNENALLRQMIEVRKGEGEETYQETLTEIREGQSAEVQAEAPAEAEGTPADESVPAPPKGKGK
jgi:hypothetical protein